MRIVCVSDAHLDARTAGVERFDEIRESFEEAVAFALDAMTPPVGLFVFLGDLCDADDARDVLRASSYLVSVAVRLSTWGVKTLFVGGNHDCCSDGETTTLAPLRPLEDLYDVEDGSGDTRRERAPVVAAWAPYGFELGEEFYVLALPYSPTPYDADAALRRAAEDARRAPRTGGMDDGRKLLVFGHLQLPGMHPGSESREMARGKDRWFPLDAMRETRPELVVNGHYHARTVTPDGIVIPGSLARLTFGEEKLSPAFLVIDV